MLNQIAKLQSELSFVSRKDTEKLDQHVDALKHFKYLLEGSLANKESAELLQQLRRMLAEALELANTYEVSLE